MARNPSLNFPAVFASLQYIPAPFACVFILLLVAPSLQAAEVLIDDFTTSQSGTSIVDGVGILGGERDSVVSGGHVLNVAAGAAVISKPANEDPGGVAIFQWAGDDDDIVVAFGLGDVDLTDGGSNQNISVEVSSVTGSVTGLLSIRESSTAFAFLDFEIDHDGTYTFAFDSLPDSGIAPDFTKINFINLRIITDPGEAITITRYSATTVIVFEDGFENSP